MVPLIILQNMQDALKPDIENEVETIQHFLQLQAKVLTKTYKIYMTSGASIFIAIALSLSIFSTTSPM